MLVVETISPHRHSDFWKFPVASMPISAGFPSPATDAVYYRKRLAKKATDCLTGRCWLEHLRNRPWFFSAAWRMQMSDVFTKEKRSQVMSRIRGKDNKDTEIVLVTLFRKHGITGWRRQTAVFGKPDFTFSKSKVVVFVDGCFWHCCPKHSNLPANNREFWLKKLSANQARDRLVVRTLRSRGWRVIRIWEHELRSPARVLTRIRLALSHSPTNGER